MNIYVWTKAADTANQDTSYFPSNNKGNARKGSFTHRAWSDQALLLCVSDHAVANPAQNNDTQHEFSAQDPEGKGPPWHQSDRRYYLNNKEKLEILLK